MTTRPRRPDAALRVVHLATHDGWGGAARAARRLHAGLCAVGVHSRVLVRDRYSSAPGIAALEDGAGSEQGRARARRLAAEMAAEDVPLRFSKIPFSDDRTAIGTDLLPAIPSADVYNLHWVGGFVDWAAVLPALARRAPIVWTLSDMNPFTGGCHYDGGCGRYREACGACPQLGSTDPEDRSAAILRRKQRTAKRLGPGALHIVAASRWLADRLRESALADSLPFSIIPRGVDTRTFRPRDREAARRALGFAPGSRVALFVATSLANSRKGFAYVAAVARAARDIPGFRLVCVGFGPAPQADRDLPIRFLDHVSSDDRMAEVMSAADVLLFPSLQEAFGLTFLEAMACGTPVVAFDTGGAADLVKSGVHGYIVPVGDARALCQAACIVLRDDVARVEMGAACRALVREGYGLEHQATRYQGLYRSLVAEAAPGR